MIISDTLCMIGVLTIALLTAEFGQVWAEYVCHDVENRKVIEAFKGIAVIKM